MVRNRLLRIGRLLGAILVLIAVWCIWNESLSVRTVIEGAILSVLALFLTNRYLLKNSYQELYGIDPFTAVRYIVVVIVQIYRSGFDAIHITIAGRLNVGIIDLETPVRNPFHGVLIANAITLTPGTVTVEYTAGRMKVIWINCITTDPVAAGEMIKGRFERVFAKTLKDQG